MQISIKEVLMKRTSITLENSIYDVGQQNASQRGFSQSFSGYVAWLLQRDAEGGVVREGTPSLRETKTRGRKPSVTIPAATTHRRGRRRAARK
ncbi:MAG: hypothetical protein ACFUZC_10130 [Chthoniobacteraceae bacterium]